MIFASKSTQGFYSTEIHGENIPAYAVEIDTEHHAELMAAQSSGKIIDWSGDIPVAVDPPTPTLAQLINAAQQQINAWRDAQEAAAIIFEHAGRRWDGGLRVRARLQPTVSAAQAAGLPAGFYWTDADNTDVSMTVSELVALDAAHEIALVQQGWKIHARQRVMKSAVEQMTADELAAFKPE